MSENISVEAQMDGWDNVSLTEEILFTLEDLSNDGRDWFLQGLVNLVDQNKMELPITLTLDGFLVSGKLISGKTYFDEFSNTFTKSFEGLKIDGDSLVELKETLSSCSNIYKNQKEGAKKQPYIHIRGVKFLHVGNELRESSDVILWRGKLTAVSGFQLGAYSKTKA